MQFIFAKNNDNKYGIIYADVPTTEAEQMRANIDFDVDGNTDAYGFINCGVDTPLFFRIARDESFERSAYYIHGIYKKAENGYFGDKEFESDIFSNFADNSVLTSIRNDGITLSQSVDESLSAESVEINSEVLKEILVRLYQGESLLLSAADDVYSNDYARCVVAKLFSNMPASLKKACGFVIGASDVGNMSGVRIRIIPEILLQGSFEPYYDISSTAHKCIAESGILAMVTAIMNSDQAEKEKIFGGFESFFGNMDYNPQNFFDYWDAYRGNAVVAEKLFDTYLSSRENPLKEDVPRFISVALSEKYRSESALEGIITLSSAEEIANPDEILRKYETEIKKLYLLYPAPTHYISEIYGKAFASMILKDSDVEIFTAAIKKFASRDKVNLPKFRECFETAVETAYSDFTNKRLAKCVELRQRVTVYVERTFTKLPPQAISDNEISKVRAAFEHNVAGAVTEAMNYGFDLSSSFSVAFDKCLNAHNEKYRPTVSLDLAKLDAVTKALVSKNIAVSDKDMADITASFGDYSNIVDMYVAKYALKKKIFPRLKNNVIFTDLAMKSGRLINIATLMLDDDPIAALYLLACYAPVTEAYEGIERLITANSAIFNALGAGKVRKDINNIGEMLHQRMGEDEVLPADIQAILEKYSDSNKALSGVCKMTAGALVSAYKAYSKGGKFAPKKSKKPLAIILIALASAAAIALLGFLFKTFILDRDWNFGGGDDQSEVSGEVSDNSSANENSNGSSGESSDDGSNESSGVSSDENSDESSGTSSNTTSDTSSNTSSDTSSNTSSDTSSSAPSDSGISGFEVVGDEAYIEYVNMAVNDTHVIAIDTLTENSRYAGVSGTWEFCMLLKPVEGHAGYYQVERVLDNVIGRDVMFNKTIDEFNNGGYVIIAFHLKADTVAEDDTDYAERLEDAKLITNGDYVLLGAYDNAIKKLQPITATFREVTPIYSE